MTVAPSPTIPGPPTLPDGLPPPPAAVPVGGSAWVQVLRACGWPTDVLVLDMETYFDREFRMGKPPGLSTIEYIQDERFEEIGLGRLFNPGTEPFRPRVATFFPDVAGELAWEKHNFGENLERCTVVMQNARFDASILAFRHGIHPPYVVDTLGLARHQDARNANDLASLCERWHLPAKGDTMQFSGLHWAGMTDDQQIAMSRYCCNDVERTMDLFAILLPRLTRPDVELRLMAHTIRLFTQPALAFDFTEADRLIAAMGAEVEKVLADVGCTREQISGNISFMELLTATGVRVPMKAGKRGLIAALAKDDDGLKELKRHPDPRVRALIAARQTVKSSPLHQKRLVSMSRQAKAAGGLLPVPLNFYGASTGRWSGGEGINLQNLGAR
jgi:DNA polymerase bacteriophage-type